jgi:hypothetical protein
LESVCRTVTPAWLSERVWLSNSQFGEIDIHQSHRGAQGADYRRCTHR